MDPVRTSSSTYTTSEYTVPIYQTDNFVSTAGFIVLLLIIAVVILYAVFRDTFRPTSDFGQYGPEIKSNCTNSTGNCNDPGTLTVTQNCIPHPVTGRGCQGKDGKQTFSPLTYTETCKLACQSSYWNPLPTSTMCIPPGIDTPGLNPSPDCDFSLPSLPSCIPPGIVGKRRTYLQCTPNDENGTNSCIRTESSLYTSPAGDTGLMPRSVLYPPGEVITINEPCTDFAIPTCGDWSFVQPEQQSVVPVTPSMFIAPCTFNLFMPPIEECIVNDSGMNGGFDVLSDGWITTPMSCVFTGNDGVQRVITPSDTDSSYPRCEVLSPPTCNSTPVKASDIVDERLDIETFNPLMCPGVNSSRDNPTCIAPCRYLPESLSIGQGQFDSLLLRYFYGVAGSDVISAQCVVDLSCPFPSDNANDIPLRAIRPPSEGSEIFEFNTSVMMFFAPREYTPMVGNTPAVLSGPIQMVIGKSLVGWLATKEQNGMLIGYWTQQRVVYGGPGISSSEAETFDITLDSAFQPETSPELPRTFLGRQIITVRKNGRDILIPNGTTIDEIAMSIGIGSVPTMTKMVLSVFSSNVVLSNRPSFNGDTVINTDTVVDTNVTQEETNMFDFLDELSIVKS